MAREIPGLVDVDTNLNIGKPEMAVRLDRPKAADLGVQVSDAAEALRLLVGGDQVTTYNERRRAVRGARPRRSSAIAPPSRRVALLPVPSSRLGSVTLDNIATFAPDSAPTEIRRLNRQRQVTVGANMQPGTSQADAQQALLEASNELDLGPEYLTGFSGRSRELNRTATAFLSALVLSLVFMYLVLAAQFESWLHPVTILLSLPLTLPFALVSLVIFGQSLNIFSALGMLVLFGVVKKNSILQIDHANQLRDEGMSTREAVIQACRDRLRPILMTTLAFVAGMFPLVFTQRRRLGHQPRDRLGGDRRPDAGAGADAGGDAGGLLAVRRRAAEAADRALRLPAEGSDGVAEGSGPQAPGSGPAVSRVLASTP